jgi:3-methyladenine DNA glycosylase AlkD
MKKLRTAESFAREIRRTLKKRGSRTIAAGTQRYFQHAIVSRGWRTAALRRYAREMRVAIWNSNGFPLAEAVANELFQGEVAEEKALAVYLLEPDAELFGPGEFDLFDSWLDRVSSWADHDEVVHFLVGPMLVRDPADLERIYRWARSRNRWRRRAAAVALIHGARRRLFFGHIKRITTALLADDDDMVQKGLGWLLREAAKADRDRVLPFLRQIGRRAPRLVLRTACETLPADLRDEVLRRPASRAARA